MADPKTIPGDEALGIIEGFRSQVQGELAALLAHIGKLEELLSARVLRCGHCGTLFFSEAYQARYCSKKCQRAQGKKLMKSRFEEDPPVSGPGQFSRKVVVHQDALTFPLSKETTLGRR